ncbi:MAG: amine dehydrogenase large subunit, partial [Pseudomonadales bacterium]|nr:amine dehydrogenase large subunit [Pseudomonadales bacterium]
MSSRKVGFFQFWQSAIVGRRAEGTCLALIALSVFSLGASHSLAELKPEPIPNVVSLSTPYPAGYAIVHDLAFGSLIDSSFALVDINTRRFKGMISAGQFSTIDFSVGRQKYYVGETIHSRGSRGQRQDIIAIYDFADLKLVGEVDLPPKRMNVVVNKSSTAITADDKFMLVFNMNPGTSITVIDLDEEAIVSEIQTPGCYMLYPGLISSFFMMCGNGSLVSISLDEKGQEIERWSSAVFNDIDRDP